MRKNKSTIIWIIVIVIVVGLFLVPRFTNPYNRKVVSEWKDNGVDCLIQGHTRLAQHIHPSLTIIIDGETEIIPANIGIVSTCMAEIHTHDATGIIHIESVVPDKKFRLAQFFSVWGKPIQREGYVLKTSVNDQPVDDPANIIFEDEARIVMEYIRL